MAEQDDFSPNERAALDAWRVPGAPEDFADRVLQRLDGEAPGRAPPSATWWKRGLALAAGLLLVYAAAWMQWPSEGHRVVTDQTTLELGRRAVAVAEPGSSLQWQVRLGGEALVNQSRGAVFYRVEPGSRFVVQTPHGTVQVMGTCFSVEVHDMKGSMLLGAAVGAAVSALVTVSVYEGQVVVATASEQQPLGPGQRATLDGRSIVLAKPAPGAPADAFVKPDGAGGVGGAAKAPAPADSPAEVARLQQQVRELELALREAMRDGSRPSLKMFEVPQAELLTMAEKCELRFDYPRFDATQPPTLEKDDAQQLGLTPAQVQAVDAVLSQYNQKMLNEVRALYTEITHDPQAGSMGVQSMIDEANDKTAAEERQRAYQNLARERAGLQAPPPDLGRTAPFERLYRLFGDAGDDLEEELAKTLGPALARRYRELHDGFQTQHRTSYGCPAR